MIWNWVSHLRAFFISREQSRSYCALVIQLNSCSHNDLSSGEESIFATVATARHASWRNGAISLRTSSSLANNDAKSFVPAIRSCNTTEHDADGGQVLQVIIRMIRMQEQSEQGNIQNWKCIYLITCRFTVASTMLSVTYLWACFLLIFDS